jgi:hypothetical protein
MGSKWVTVIGVMVGAFFFCGPVLAQHGHDHGKSSSVSSATVPAKKPAQSLTVEGWKISLEVMSMEEHQKHTQGGHGHGSSPGQPSFSHSLMITAQDTFSKEIISDARGKFTILSPSGKKDTGSFLWSGDHYVAGFNPQEKGVYQIQVTLEGGGMERGAKFNYDVK